MIYEWRVYHIAEDKMPNILARFRDVTMGLFDRHEIFEIGVSVRVNLYGSLQLHAKRQSDPIPLKCPCLDSFVDEPSKVFEHSVNAWFTVLEEESRAIERHRPVCDLIDISHRIELARWNVRREWREGQVASDFSTVSMQKKSPDGGVSRWPSDVSTLA